MRVLHKSTNEKITADVKGFSAIGRIIQIANQHRDAKMVFDMKKTKSVDGNLATVYAALGRWLGKSNNQLRILPRKACGTDVGLTIDLFGNSSGWELHLEETFQSGATNVFAFDRHNIDGFKNYLLHDAFRKDWRGLLPYHYKLDAKAFLMALFESASEHSEIDEPIFVQSSYDGSMLRFTFIDCGVGFQKVLSKLSAEIVNEGEAIAMAMHGYSSRIDLQNCSLKSLGNYCDENDGELFVISENASVLFDKDGFHRVTWLPGAFRGSVINFSVKVKLPEFLQQAA